MRASRRCMRVCCRTNDLTVLAGDVEPLLSGSFFVPIVRSGVVASCDDWRRGQTVRMQAVLTHTMKESPAMAGDFVRKCVPISVADIAVAVVAAAVLPRKSRHGGYAPCLRW